MSETDGQSKSRLDRIEEMIERQERANEAAHERFEDEDKRLLTAQILMNDAMRKMAVAIEKSAETAEKASEAAEKASEAAEKASAAAQKATEAVEKLSETVQLMVQGMISLELKMEETTAKLNALIEIVDGIIRKKP